MSTEALSPQEIVMQTLTSSVRKVRKSVLTTFLLGILAGAFIGLGALFFTIVKSDATFSFATQQLVGGLVFSVGLILVVVAGAELFTGNNLIAISWANKRISTTEMIQNWIIILVSNMLGAISLVLMVYLSGHINANDGAIAKAYVDMAIGKTSLSFTEAFLRGVLCNILVCLGVWMAMGGKTVTDKILAIIFPITLFVAAGFEHSIANLYILPMGWLIQQFAETATVGPQISFTGIVNNLIPVILGNIVGGSILVGLMYHFIYLRNQKNDIEASSKKKTIKRRTNV